MKGRRLVCLGLLVVLVAMGSVVVQAQEPSPPPPPPKFVVIVGLTPMYGENPWANGLGMIAFLPDYEGSLFGDAYYFALIGGFEPDTLYRITFQDINYVGGFVETGRYGDGTFYLEVPDVVDPTLFADISYLEVYQDLNQNMRWDVGEPGAKGDYTVVPFP